MRPSRRVWKTLWAGQCYRWVGAARARSPCMAVCWSRSRRSTSSLESGRSFDLGAVGSHERGVAVIDRIAEIWGSRTPYSGGTRWPARVDQFVEEGVSETDVHWVQSACVLCSNGCGMDIGVHDGRIVGVRGRSFDRVNHGRLGPKGLFGWQANNSPDRLGKPLIRRDGRLQPADWDEAMDLVVERSRQVLNAQGPLGMAFYNSGQLFLEDYYTLAVLVRGGIGTPHLDGNTRLCTATSDYALKESFGTDGAPGCLEDLDVCDTLLSVGHNMPETHTVMWMRVLDRLRGPNVALLNCLLRELIVSGNVDDAFVAAHTIGFDRLTDTVADYEPSRVS